MININTLIKNIQIYIRNLPKIMNKLIKNNKREYESKPQRHNFRFYLWMDSSYYYATFRNCQDSTSNSINIESVL